MNNEINYINTPETNEVPIQNNNIMENQTHQVEQIEPEITNVANSINQEVQIQSQFQNIPTVGQNQEQFINNVQTMNQEKKDEKKDNMNPYILLVIAGIMAVAIYFLFPILSKYI